MFQNEKEQLHSHSGNLPYTLSSLPNKDEESVIVLATNTPGADSPKHENPCNMQRCIGTSFFARKSTLDLTLYSPSATLSPENLRKAAHSPSASEEDAMKTLSGRRLSAYEGGKPTPTVSSMTRKCWDRDTDGIAGVVPTTPPRGERIAVLHNGGCYPCGARGEHHGTRNHAKEEQSCKA